MRQSLPRTRRVRKDDGGLQAPHDHNNTSETPSTPPEKWTTVPQLPARQQRTMLRLTTLGLAGLAALARADQTTTVCMDGEHAAVLTKFEPSSAEYLMLMRKYQHGVADSMGLRPDDVLVVAGLKAGERVITSAVAVPLPGLKLAPRTQGAGRVSSGSRLEAGR